VCPRRLSPSLTATSPPAGLPASQLAIATAEVRPTVETNAAGDEPPVDAEVVAGRIPRSA